MTTGNAFTRIGSLVLHEPERARAEILEALERSAGRIARAAIELGICRRQLLRYVWALDMWPAVDGLRETFRAKLGRVRHNEGVAHVVSNY